MKKTLVALAVLAVSGVASAQVAVSGKLGFSYQKNATVAGGAANHGMAMTDGDLNFSATEDLGGGTKITAQSAFASRGRDNTFAARDASLTLATNAATFTLGSVEKCSRIDNVAGAPIALASGFDSGAAGPLAFGTFTLDGGCHNVDTAGVAIGMGAVTLGASYNEVRNVPANAVGADLTYSTLSADAALGNLSLGLEVQSANSREGGANQTYHDGLLTTRFTASYNLGVAVVGAGVQTANHDSPNQTTLSVAVPLGNATLGMTYANRAATSAASQFGQADAVTGTAVGVDYRLSKMTTVNASYGMYSNNAVNGNEYRVRLMKSF